MTSAPPTASPDRALWPLQLAVAFFMVFRLYIDAAMPPIGDEAYYWLWGQRLALSYFDHPPLHAWLLRLMDIVFGWNLFSLRVLTWFTLAGTLAIFWAWASRLAPASARLQFWRMTALYLASPLFLIMTSISFHDHLLIFLCFAAAFMLLDFVGTWEATGKGYGRLYLGALLLGLAVLTKYNAVLFALGAALFFILRPALRGLFRTPHPYLAALLSVIVQAPVLYWNLSEGFASYRFHASERWAEAPIHFDPLRLGLYLLVTIAVVSPFLIGPLGRVLFSKTFAAGGSFPARLRGLAVPVFLTSTLAMAGLALFVSVFFYWNILAFLLLMPLLAMVIGRWQFRFHIGYGVIMALALAFNSTIIPFGNSAQRDQWAIASAFGWNDVATEIQHLTQLHPDVFIAATRYSTAAQLGYALRDPGVTALSPRHDQFDFWFDPAIHAGEDAIIVSDATLGIAALAPQFDTLELITTLTISHLGVTIYEPEIYLARNFHARVSPAIP